ncbi:hypothetical protein FW800_22315 [Pseudomonas sp. 910_23]|uniref:Uncharacterized protein n=1 Tax=Pseudomonas synxantha TaxID=47883 RepID=A0A5D3GAG1_9PSED|nr:hypothetical protein [Pseudomonas fluorescens]MCK3838337.1 hypothetical protein [Pseudomonas sp. NCIMB 10586]MCK3842689.1 hypothetical protein [Pseudomonas sp. W15Feb34]MCK3863636.1 hypothetical protein [Pseudomonas sp. B329]OPB10020.1 hypothetical protein BFW89_03130 [Pseudomonas synxantha]
MVTHGKTILWTARRAVFERGMLAQHLLLFRAPSRSKRYMNIPTSLAANRLKCGRGLAPDSSVSVSTYFNDPSPSGASPLPHSVAL